VISYVETSEPAMMKWGCRCNNIACRVCWLMGIAVLREGYFARQIRRIRNLNNKRREVLIQNLQTEFGEMLEARGAEAGMHLAATLSEGCRYRDLRQSGEAGAYAWQLSPSYIKRPPRQHFILGLAARRPIGYPPPYVHESLFSGLVNGDRAMSWFSPSSLQERRNLHLDPEELVARSSSPPIP
jgi:hypothetical protein